MPVRSAGVFVCRARVDDRVIRHVLDVARLQSHLEADVFAPGDGFAGIEQREVIVGQRAGVTFDAAEVVRVVEGAEPFAVEAGRLQ